MPKKKDPEITQYKLKDGKTYFRLRTYIGTNPENGKSIKVTRSKLATRKEAEQLRNKLKAKGPVAIAHKHDLAKQKNTFTDVWNSWLEIYKLSVRGSTVRSKKTIWDNTIGPEFGSSYIANVTSDHIQKFVNNLAENYTDYREYIGLLRCLIKYALVKGYIDVNPLDKVIIPRKSKKPHRFDPKTNYYEPKELKRFLSAAKQLHFEWYVYFYTVASLGLRRGEGLALKWSDIDFKKRKIYIRRTVTIDEYDHKMLGPTKTDDKYRKINGLTLSNDLYQILKDFRAYRTKWYDTNPFLFHTKEGEYYTTQGPNFWVKQLYKKDPTLKKITLHGLRHTFATLMFDTNGNIKPQDVSYLLGHKRVETTLDIYTSISKKKKEEINSAINNLKI